MALWSSDFLLGHILLIILTPPIFLPFIDRLHSTMLCQYTSFLTVKSSNFIFRLATTIKADSCAIVLYEAETSEAMDCTLLVLIC